MIRQADAGLPIRILVPKARKMGVSTLVSVLFWELCGDQPDAVALVLAHTAKDTQGLWRITKRLNAKGWDQKSGRVTKSDVVWSNRSEFGCYTAGARAGGRGDTINYLHLSELAYYNIHSEGQDVESTTAVLNAVPKNEPDSIVVIESTGAGPDGEFYRRCDEARKPGYDGDYTLCFFPWFADPTYTLRPPAGWSPGDDLRVLGNRYDLSFGQLYWFHKAKQDQSNPTVLKREFPACLDDCFEAAHGRVYPLFSRDIHVKTVEDDGTWHRYRALDWGGRDPLVCLWIAKVPGPPGLTIDPECEDLIREMYAYLRDPKTHKPIDANNHGPDALRYAVTTFRLYDCHVYVYRSGYWPEFASGEKTILHILDDIQTLSGWIAQPTLGEMQYVPGPGAELFEGNVGDRQRPDTIQLFNAHNFGGLVGQRNLRNQKTQGTMHPGVGEIEQGCEKVNELLTGEHAIQIDPRRVPLTKVEKMLREARRPSHLRQFSSDSCQDALDRDHVKRDHAQRPGRRKRARNYPGMPGY